MLDIVCGWFDEVGGAYHRDEDLQALYARFRGEEGEWVLVFDAADPRMVVLESFYPWALPHSRRPEALDLCARLADQVGHSAFLVGTDEGTVSLRTSVFRSSEPATMREAFGHAMRAHLAGMDAAYPAIHLFVHGSLAEAAAARMDLEARARSARRGPGRPEDVQAAWQAIFAGP